MAWYQSLVGTLPSIGRRSSLKVERYRCVQQHLETWLAQCRAGHHDDGPVPPYVEREFRRYLDCGILAHGSARARYGQCGHDFLIAFSCKGRGVCPSCNTRRRVATAAHLTDHVVPPLPVRQWVLAVPKRLRYFLHRDAGLQGAALRLFLRAVELCLRAHSSDSGPAEGALRRLCSAIIRVASTSADIAYLRSGEAGRHRIFVMQASQHRLREHNNTRRKSIAGYFDITRTISSTLQE